MSNPCKEEAEVGGTLRWRTHVSNLLKEILVNKGTWALARPIDIFGKQLFEVAQRAAELDDPKLNLLMLELTLYEIADADIHPDQKGYREAVAEQKRRIENGE